MWKSNEQPAIENLDNHLAAIDMAKEELNKINKDIQIASERRVELLSGNDVILKEKLKEIEDQEANLKSLQDEANDIHSKNAILADELDSKLNELNKDIANLLSSKDRHMDEVKNKENDFDIRQEDLNKILSDIEKSKLVLDAKIKEDEEILENIISEREEARKVVAQLLNEKSSLVDEKIAIQKEHDAINKLRDDLSTAQSDVNEKASNAQEALLQSRKNNAESAANLDALLKEKQTFSDLIIESKRIKVEAIKATEAAQRNIVEANQKIAELRDLKEAMAQQEK